MVWAKLQALCVPPTAFINVPPLVDHTYGYNSPGREGTACQCNVVAYNLMVSRLHHTLPVRTRELTLAGRM